MVQESFPNDFATGAMPNSSVTYYVMPIKILLQKLYDENLCVTVSLKFATQERRSNLV
jgi:hypothetical protein